MTRTGRWGNRRLGCRGDWSYRLRIRRGTNINIYVTGKLQSCIQIINKVFFDPHKNVLSNQPRKVLEDLYADIIAVYVCM